MPVYSPYSTVAKMALWAHVKSRYAVKSAGTLEAKIEKCWYSVTGPLKALLFTHTRGIVLGELSHAGVFSPSAILYLICARRLISWFSGCTGTLIALK